VYILFNCNFIKQGGTASFISLTADTQNTLASIMTVERFDMRYVFSGLNVLHVLQIINVNNASLLKATVLKQLSICYTYNKNTHNTLSTVV